MLRGASMLVSAKRPAAPLASVSVRRCLTTRQANAGAITRSLLKHQSMRRMFASKTYPPHTTINMPALSPTMTAGNIGVWNKKVGDEISAGDVLVEIETDKAQMDFECQDEGFLAKILVDGGSKEVKVNSPIAIMVENAEDVAKFADYEVSSAAAAPAPAAAKKATPAAVAPAAPAAVASAPASLAVPASTGRVLASPVAKKIAHERGIDLAQVNGTGPKGRVTKYDVTSFEPTAAKAPAKSVPAAFASPAAMEPSTADYTEVPLTNMRKVIASRLQESKGTIPHYYLTTEVTMDKLMNLRKVLNDQAGTSSAYKLSVNDFIIKAAALTLKSNADVNSSWTGETIRRYHSADISVAVSTPSGLITPIVKKAETLGLAAISNQVKDLASRARDNKLAPHEYQGGTFTISNLGMFGVKQFTAIINPPQSCILAVGASDTKLVPDASQPNGFRAVNTMHVTLSCDHRVVDGAVGAQWLKQFKEHMENPLTLML